MKWLPEMEAVLTVELGLIFDVDRPLTSVMRFCICSCEKIIFGKFVFYSKEEALLVVGICGVKRLVSCEKIEPFSLGPFHPGRCFIS